MAVDYRKDRKKWGFRKTYRGEVIVRRYFWDTKEAVQEAYEEFLRTEFRTLKKIPKNCLVNLVNDYLMHTTQRRSKWRVQGLSYTFSKIIVPYFGATTLITAIDRSWVEQFILDQKRRPIKVSTVWHYFTDLKALFNYALQHPRGQLVAKNPCAGVDRNLFKGRKVVKPPFDPAMIEKAAKILSFNDRIYFDHIRFTGARKDEANRTTWTDLILDDPDNAWWNVSGSKTEESREILPLPPAHAHNLIRWREICPSQEWVFPSCEAKSKTFGQRMYHRRRMIERIHKALDLRITVKDLRDYYCNEVAANTDDVTVLRDLMRHTSLTTTTRYTRIRRDRMRAAVQNLGSGMVARFGGNSISLLGINIPFNSFPAVSKLLTKLGISIDDLKENFGGGGRTRTVDSADMSQDDDP